MATRLKTIEYHFPVLGSISDNTKTYFTPITIYLPESSIVFKSVSLDIYVDDITTATGNNVTTRTLTLSLGASGEETVSNVNALTNTGENLTFFVSGDFTSYFSNNWSGTSMSCSISLLTIQSGGTTTGMRDATAQIFITYEYDDTSITQIKTVRLPLNAPVSSLANSKPGSAVAVIPALDSWLPENDKDIKELTIIVQGNDAINATRDITISAEIDSDGAMTTNARAAALASARWFRYFFSLDTNPSNFDTSASHNFYIWCSAASKCYHLQAWLNIVYEYNEETSTTIMNSILLPMEIDSPFGGHNALDYQTARRQFYIEEDTPISLKESALFIFWDDISAMTGLNFNINDNAWIAYTDAAANLCGGNGAMVRCESYLSLARGINNLIMGVYRTVTTVGGFNANALWMINYTSTKNSNGSGAHNHTIIKNITTTGTGATIGYVLPVDIYFTPPEEYYYYNSIGFHYLYNSGTGYGATIQCMRKSSEEYQKWEIIYLDLGQTDAEYGIRQILAQAKDVFKRFKNDAGDNNSRMDLSTLRNYRIWLGGSGTAFHHLNFMITYHSITSTISGNVSNYTGDGTDITIDIFRANTCEKIATTLTTSGGDYSFVWYDNTEPLYAVARQAGAYVGRSDNAYAVLDNPS